MLKLIEKLSEKMEFSKHKTFGTKPLFFRLHNEMDKINFEQLLADNSLITVHDNFREQIEELNKINAIQNRLLGKKKVVWNDNYNQSFISEGVWIYYPWLNKVTHILDEEDFITVRTNRNQHKITAKEQESLKKRKVGIIGLSVGQSIATTLVLERCCGEIRIADFDTIELSNLNRIKTGLYNLGLKKIVQVAREIAELDPYIKVVCYEDGITEDSIDDFLVKDGKLDLMIEECDSLDIKIVSRLKAKQYGIPVLMETNDKGMVDIERYDLDANYPLLHNLIGDVSWKELSNLTNEQKVPMMMKLTNFANLSFRQKLTALEIGQTISTWPQLASSVVMGAGITADVARRILLNELHISGRFYVDIESIIKDTQSCKSSYLPPLIKELTSTEMHDTAVRIKAHKKAKTLHISKEIIEKLVLDASMAPSSGNDQPWKFFISDDTLFLFHEIARSYSFGDYKNIASYISLGGTIENLVLSTHKQKLEVSITLFPETGNSICVAMFEFKNAADDTTEIHCYDSLHSFISERCTNRKVTYNQIPSQNILQELKQAAESVDQVKASFVTDQKSLHTLGNIISAGDRIRIMHPQGHYDFFNREIKSSAETQAAGTGMDIASLELSQQAALALEIIRNEEAIQVMRDVNGLQALKNVSVPSTINSSAMGFIETRSYSPADFVRGGRAMQRQWLTSTKLGYAYHPMVIPLYLFNRLQFGDGEGLDDTIAEVREMRKQFMEIFPGEEKRGEILLFRIFKAQNNNIRSPRLPLSKILFTN